LIILLTSLTTVSPSIFSYISPHLPVTKRSIDYHPYQISANKCYSVQLQVRRQHHVRRLWDQVTQYGSASLPSWSGLTVKNSRWMMEYYV
jgi:hypothetical protein